MGWDEARHPRGHGGKFARIADRIADRAADVHATSTHGPRQIPAHEFESTVPNERRLYRGVTNRDAAAHTRAGLLGGGDYGRGVYMGTSVDVAQGYAQTGMRANPDGVIIRGHLNPGAVVKEPPPKVARGGSAAIDKWADENGIDVVDLGNYQVVRNPAAMTLDGHDYTIDESVVLSYRANGYKLDDPKYADAAASVDRAHRRR